MIALIRYTLAGFARSQRYLPPALLFITAVTVLTTNGIGPLVAAYAACAMAQFLCLVWLTIALVNAEDPIQRSMTTVAAGGSRRVLVASVWTAVLACACLTAVGSLYPILGGEYTATSTAVAIGIVAQLTGGVAGIAVGLVCSRLVVPRPGYALVTALCLIGAMTLVPPVPPVSPTMRLLANERPPEAMLGSLAAQLGIAGAMLVLSMVITQAIVRRRA